jgi:hypothetical protein
MCKVENQGTIKKESSKKHVTRYIVGVECRYIQMKEMI